MQYSYENLNCSVLYLLKDILGDGVDLRFYNVRNKSFHPKAYMFTHGDEGDIFIGSSNISKSALTEGIEWNYRICKSEHKEDFAYYKRTFEDLFLNHSIVVDEAELKKYSASWVRPKVSRNFADNNDSDGNLAQKIKMNLKFQRTML